MPEPSETANPVHRQRALEQVLETFALGSASSPENPDKLDVHSRSEYQTESTGTGRLYGGTTFALAYLAAHKTVGSHLQLHSVRGTFLRAGRGGRDLRCGVERLRDGRSFSNRRVSIGELAKQATSQPPSGRERKLFEGDVSFRTRAALRKSLARTGIEHSIATPPSDAPPPELCPDREQLRTERLGREWLSHPVNAVEIRLTEPRHLEPEIEMPPRALNWMRIPNAHGLSESLQIALLLFASDRALLSTAALPHGILWTKSQAVTLNHSVWLHRVPKVSDWHLMVAESRIAVDGLALLHLEIFDQQQELVATAVQEALVQY